MSCTATAASPEYNVTGVDFSDLGHLSYDGPIIDIHAHVFLSRPTDPPTGPPIGSTGEGVSLGPAELMLDAAADYGVVHTVAMCLPENIPALRARFGSAIGFNGWISKPRPDDPDEAAYRLLDRFLDRGVRMLKFWAAPRGRDWGMTLDAPYRIECLRRARYAGVNVVMVHVADPDALFRTAYADASRYGTKADQYVAFRALLEAFPEVTWIAAHMGGDPEHPDHLESLLERYPHLMFDSSAAKWQVREVSARAEAVRSLMCRYPDRFLFGSDLVSRHHLPRDHFRSRYWTLRTLWESRWQGPSPIADPDHAPGHDGGETTPTLHGLRLPPAVLEKFYHANARALLGGGEPY
jgi:predicted TIM-barrel fold metal-dependent hydrolase